MTALSKRSRSVCGMQAKAWTRRIALQTTAGSKRALSRSLAAWFSLTAVVNAVIHHARAPRVGADRQQAGWPGGVVHVVRLSGSAVGAVPGWRLRLTQSG